jgi:predicted ATPase
MEAKPFLKEILLKRNMVPSFDVYPFQIPAIRSLSSLKFHRDVTFIIGENGSGKSTLIEAIALHMGFGTEGGSKNAQFQTHNNSSQLFNYLSGIKSFKKPTDYFFLRAESYYNLATYMETPTKVKKTGIRLKGNTVSDRFMSAHMANRSWLRLPTGSPATDFIYSMSPRPPYRPTGKWRRFHSSIGL